MAGTAQTELPGVTSTAPRHRALAVDDEFDALSTIETVLAGSGFTVDPVTNGAAALEVLGQDPGRYDLVVFDFDMPDVSGLDLLEQAHCKGWAMPILVTADQATVGAAVEAIRRGAFDLLLKPFSPTERLRDASRRAVAASDVVRRVPQLVSEADRDAAVAPGPRGWVAAEELVPLAQAKRTFERRYLSRLLEQTGGNRAAASRIAGMDPSNLRRLLRRHGMIG